MKTKLKGDTGLGVQPEARYFEQAQAGCQESLNLLMARHEGLVVTAVNRQNLGDMLIEEAVQAGREGLWHAILGYEPHRGYQFSTYAYPAIVRRVWQAVKQYMRGNLRAHVRREYCLYFPHWQIGPGALQAQKELCECLDELVDRLPQRLRTVMRAYYGLDGDETQNYREIGTELGVTKQRIQQLHVEALVWLRHPAHSQELRALLQRHSQQEYKWAEEVAQAWLRRRGGRCGHPD
jgi:RNA polymerase sigma factor (sigma-70 family)